MTLSLNVLDAAYERFLVAPDKDSYLHLRTLMLQAPELVRCWSDLQELESWCHPSDEDPPWEQFLDRTADLAAAWRLCSRFHYLVAVAAEQHGDLEESQLARFQLSACLEGMLSTGDGSIEAPFRVLHTTDIYDVLKTLKKKPQSQHVACTRQPDQEDRRGRRPDGAQKTRPLGEVLGGGCYDIVTCADGSHWFFDRSDLGALQPEIGDEGFFASRLSELNL